MLPPGLTGGGTAGFVNRGRFRQAFAVEIFALEELLRDGGDLLPRREIFRRDFVGEAEAFERGHALELEGEELPREVVEGGFVERAEEFLRPGAAAGGRGEIERHGERTKITGFGWRRHHGITKLTELTEFLGKGIGRIGPMGRIGLIGLRKR